MKDIIETNELVVWSYAKTVKGIQNTEQKLSENLVHPLPASTTAERSTIQFLGEYTDRERERKQNLIIHNIPESDCYGNTVEDVWKYLSIELKSSIDAHIPKSCPTKDKTRKIWINRAAIAKQGESTWLEHAIEKLENFLKMN